MLLYSVAFGLALVVIIALVYCTNSRLTVHYQNSVLCTSSTALLSSEYGLSHHLTRLTCFNIN
jgi:hypothetical protein